MRGAHRRATLALFAFVAWVACAPVTERGRGDEAGERAGSASAASAAGESDELFDYRADAGMLSIGERVPDVELRDADDRSLMLSSFRGRAVVLGFIGPHGDNANDEEALRRLAAFGRELSPRLAKDVTILTVVLGAASGSPVVSRARGAAPPVDVPWTFVSAMPGDAASFAASFGVVAWRYGDGSTGHNFDTVIIDPAGRFVDHFPGLEGWSPRDLVAAVAVALGH